MDAALFRHLDERALLERGIGGAFGNDGVAETLDNVVRRLVHFLPEGAAETGIAVELLLAVQIRRRDRPEERHALEDEGLFQLILEVERARRHLREDVVALPSELERARQLFLVTDAAA